MVVPSGFLREVFAHHGADAEIVPNIIDLARFTPDPTPLSNREPHIVIARHLEAIYGIDTALRAFALVRRELPAARMTVAGQGPEAARLRVLAGELGLAASVDFCGQLDRDGVAALLRGAAVSLNASRVDNMPNSVLEALASGVPVVSTNVGGVPWLVRDGQTALLVPPDDASAMAVALVRVLTEPALASALASAGRAEAQAYGWPRVREQWAAVYGRVRRVPAAQTRAA